jgi:hypothetical protein
MMHRVIQEYTTKQILEGGLHIKLRRCKTPMEVEVQCANYVIIHVRKKIFLAVVFNRV